MRVAAATTTTRCCSVFLLVISAIICLLPTLISGQASCEQDADGMCRIDLVSINIRIVLNGQVPVNAEGMV